MKDDSVKIITDGNPSCLPVYAWACGCWLFLSVS